MNKYILWFFIPIAFFLASCSEKYEFIDTSNIDSIAVSYVKLSFALSRFDADYVDGYFGPDYIKDVALQDTIPLSAIIDMADYLIKELDNNYGNSKQRPNVLSHLLLALKTRAELFNGKKYSFDIESDLIYNVRSPIYSPEIYKNALAQIDSLLPGIGTVAERWNDFRKNLIVPYEHLDTLFKIAIEECRHRSLINIPMPEGESFEFQLIDSAPWGAYNWFKGNAKSLIQINAGLPIYIDRIIDYACHEGYPGHHVFHTLHESVLYKKNGEIEHSIIPLFSPVAVISEGLANYGINIAFTEKEKIAFEKNTLCKIAGISPDLLDRYYSILELRRKLKYAGIETARRYLDGRMSRDMAIQWLIMYELRTPQEAENSIRFIEKYRTYILTYSVGYDLLNDYFQKTALSREEKWKLYRELIVKPVLPKDLR